MTRYPVAGVAFVVGMLGVPPTFGFAGRYRLYMAGAQTGSWLLALMILATGLALLYYVRATHRVWFGPALAPGSGAAAGSVPRLAAVLIVLAGLALLLGFWPTPITTWLP